MAPLLRVQTRPLQAPTLPLKALRVLLEALRVLLEALRLLLKVLRLLLKALILLPKVLILLLQVKESVHARRKIQLWMFAWKRLDWETPPRKHATLVFQLPPQQRLPSGLLLVMSLQLQKMVFALLLACALPVQ
jgi:hypothetical protein